VNYESTNLKFYSGNHYDNFMLFTHP